MQIVEFEQLPNDSKLWIFSLRSALASDTLVALRKEIEQFIATWKAHGRPVLGAVAFPYGQFIAVAADPSFSEVSGCSIDALFKSIETICSKFGIELTDPATIYFKDRIGNGSAVSSLPRDSFAELCSAGSVTPQTVVFNNAVSALAELRAGRWELPFSESWHAKRFTLLQTS